MLNLNGLSLLFAMLVLFLTVPARAQEVGALSPPPAAPDLGSICTDRPTKSNFACSVPAGQIQIETDLANWTRTTVAGAQADVVLVTNPTVKYGLGDHSDVEINLVPYQIARFRDATGVVTTQRGVGDLYLRLKQQLTADDAKLQVGIIPYVKAPTAPVGLGNGIWEGGAIVAVNIALPQGFTLTVDPEVDVLADGDLSGRHHAGLTMLTNLSHPLGKKVTVYGELWTQQNLDPAGHVHQYSVDAAVTYLVTPTWQLDIGGNVGLNRATPGRQLYLGLSTRF